MTKGGSASTLEEACADAVEVVVAILNCETLDVRLRDGVVCDGKM